jgi:hypothetical protein
MFSYEVRGSVSKATPAFRIACTEAMTYITNTTLKTSMEAPETMFGFHRTFGREGLHKRDRPIVNIIHKTSMRNQTHVRVYVLTTRVVGPLAANSIGTWECMKVDPKCLNWTGLKDGPRPSYAKVMFQFDHRNSLLLCRSSYSRSSQSVSSWGSTPPRKGFNTQLSYASIHKVWGCQSKML